MSIVVIGKNGQLAQELSRLDSNISLIGRDDINIVNYKHMANVLDEFKLDSIINASAYTAVDKAENDKENTYLLNSQAVRNLAKYCHKRDCHFTHISTDYVFSGDKGAPYKVDDTFAPIGVYGASKADGERAIGEIHPDKSCILRTSWVYSIHGNNFVKTMLRLMSEKPELGVIDDQIGSPTWAKGLAQACLYASEQKVTGIHHWTDCGVAIWYDFAVAIQRTAIEKGLLDTAILIKAIPTSAYPTPARRPSYSVLDKSSLALDFPGLNITHWQEQLSTMMSELV
jgi:dTDP-4-dehydrorhamnose reductase